MITLRGTAGPNRLAGRGDESFRLIGLAGDDTYTLRLFDDTIYRPDVPPEVVYLRDQVSEARAGGSDTVILVNQYNPFGITGITPIGHVGPAELHNVERIVATTRIASGEALSWSITAGAENNTILGSKGDDRLGGGGGNDLLNGGAGDDVLVGGSGRDRLVGGAGDDTVSFAANQAGLQVRLGAGSGVAAGDRLSRIESVEGTNRADRMTAGAGESTLAGRGGNDVLAGGKGDDTLLGGSGNDSLAGGSGDDRLDPGGGIDRMTGGAGRDRFEFAFDAGHRLKDGIFISYFKEVSFRSTITDFENGIDKIVIDQATAEEAGVNSTGRGPEPGDILIRAAGRDSIVYFGDPGNKGDQPRIGDLAFGSVVLKNVDADQIDLSDFLFV